MPKKFSYEYYNLIDQYKYVHKHGIRKKDFFIDNNRTFDGKSLGRWINTIKKIIIKTNSKSILDYGCGKAKYYNNEFQIEDKIYKNLKKYWNVSEIKLFDPGVKEFETYPNKNYDGVICTDVLEHISSHDLDYIVKDIFNFSNKFAFFVISTVLDEKFLPDGRNVHQTVKNEKWWEDFFYKIKVNFSNIECVVVATMGEKGKLAKRII